MSRSRTAVIGAGPAGLACALALARAGHRVSLLEQDPAAAAGSDPLGWERRGVPHFVQPHMLIPRAAKELRESFPDVYADLLAAGASAIDLRSRLDGPPLPGDEDLQYLAVRRPLIEAALRSAALDQPGLDVRLGGRVEGLVVRSGRIVGVRGGRGVLDADVVVDAMGRRSPMTRWLEPGNSPLPVLRTSPCGVVYYSRYYRLRAGQALPPGPWLLGPRGDLGYLGYATFPGDNGTFAALLAVPTGVPALKELRHREVFDAAVARIPSLSQWVHPDLVEATTPVLAMAGLANTLAGHGPAAPVGLFAVGDALGHTDPTLAHGIAFGLIHAGALVAALAQDGDLRDCRDSFTTATAPALQERFELASALGSQRHRAWTGGTVDLAHRDGDYALFSVVAAGAAALVDPAVLRVFVRRVGLLDSTKVLDDDPVLQGHIEGTFARLRDAAAPVAPPSMEELLAVS